MPANATARDARLAKCLKRLASCGIIWFCFGISPAEALEIVQTFNKPNTLTTWNVPVALNQFDPALGTLTEVRIAMSTTWSGSGQITNNTGATGVYDIYIRGRVAVTKTQRSDGDLGTSADRWLMVSATSADPLSPDELTIASGVTQPYAPADFSNSGNTTKTSGTDLAAFTGTGTLPIYLQAVGDFSITGPSPFTSSVTTSALSSVTLTYVYLPEPATWVMAGLAAAAMACVIRKRRTRSDGASAAI